MGIFYQTPVRLMYIDEAILMSTQNIFFKVKYEKFPKLSLTIYHLGMLGIFQRLESKFETATTEI